MAALSDILRVRREIAKAAGVRVARRAIPRKREPVAARLRYQQHLTQMTKTLRSLLEDELFPRLPQLVTQAAQDRGGLRQDSATDEVSRLFGDMGLIFGTAHPPGQTADVVAQVGAEVDSKNLVEHQRQMKAALGIELITPEPFRQAAVAGFIADNQDLVQSLYGGQLDAFKAITGKGLRSGLRVESIRDELMAKLGVTKGRAALLARDQTLKLFGELTELRQINVGIEEYDWDSSGDERVRPVHAQLHGTRQRWDKPPVIAYATKTQPERRGHPGSDYQCRCQAIPVIPEELLQEPVISQPASKPVAKPKPVSKPVAKPKPVSKPVAKPKAVSKPVAKPKPVQMLEYPIKTKGMSWAQYNSASFKYKYAVQQNGPKWASRTKWPGTFGEIQVGADGVPLSRPADMTPAQFLTWKKKYAKALSKGDYDLLPLRPSTKGKLVPPAPEFAAPIPAAPPKYSDFAATQAAKKAAAAAQDTATKKAAKATQAAKKASAPRKPQARMKSKTDWSYSLSTNEKEAIRYWQGNGYRQMRSLDAGGKGSNLAAKALERMQRAMDRAPVYRGRINRGIVVSKADAQALSKPGSTFKQKSLSSWSKQQSIAEDFAGYNSKPDNSFVIFRVYAEKAGVDIEGVVSGTLAEAEVVVPKGQAYRVVRRLESTNAGRKGYYVDLEEI